MIFYRVFSSIAVFLLFDKHVHVCDVSLMVNDRKIESHCNDNCSFHKILFINMNISKHNINKF